MPKFIYGWKRQPHDPRDFKMLFSPRRLATLPSAVSLAPNMSQPDMQGDLGSCGPNTADEHLKFDFKAQGLPVRNTSRLFTYYNTRSLMGSQYVNQDSGVDNRTMLKALNKFGFCDETLWPYDINKFKQKPPQAAFDAAASNKITSYAAVATDLQQMKACLASGHPFIFGFDCFEAIESFEVGSSGLLPDPRPGETPIGGHDVLCFGYDDAKGMFKMTNHWDQWGVPIDGINGCFWISYAYASNPKYASDFWVINAVPSGVPTPPAPPSPPPGPSPSPTQSFTIPVPRQPVMIGNMAIGYVPAYTLTGTIGGAHADGATITIPPWMLVALKLACQFAPSLPAPWNAVGQFVCGLLPDNVNHLAASGESLKITLPPWILMLVKAACANSGSLPPIVGMLCSLLPQQMQMQMNAVEALPCHCQ